MLFQKALNLSFFILYYLHPREREITYRYEPGDVFLLLLETLKNCLKKPFFHI